MKKRGKKYQAKIKLLKTEGVYEVEEAFTLLKEASYAKFDETIDLAVRLGVDVKKSDQLVRGSLSLPYGTGKSPKILVIAAENKIEEAQNAGADFAGGDDLLEKIGAGFVDFDVMVATPNMMAKVGRLGKVLGPKGLMPSPKSGTVTMELEKTVKEFKAGKREFRVDKFGIVHLIIGKVSFDADKLKENLLVALKEILKAKPSGVKGTYIKSVAISSTMGPGLMLDLNLLIPQVEKM